MLPTPDEAESIVLESVPSMAAEICPLDRAQGRILRTPIVADRDLPPFDRVTMDGFALAQADWAAGRREFTVAGFQPAGVAPSALRAPGTCLEIATGAVIPPGADCVVPYEETTRSADRMTIAADSVLRPGRSIHPRGSDFAAGREIVRAGTRITGREIAVAAACGFAQVSVSCLPRVAVIATGDELVDVAAAGVAPHQIRRSNDHALRAALAGAGYGTVECLHLRDIRAEIVDTLRRVLGAFDVVLLTGGVSKGKFDFLPGVLAELGVEKKLHGVAQRPGKPFWFGLAGGRVPVFALPGNPVSTYTCFHRYVLPALAKMSGATPAKPDYVALAAPVTFSPPLAYLLPVAIAVAPTGERRACHRPTNTSGDFAGLVDTDGFVELPADRSEFAAGTVARYWRWV
jgi:molybdopterin molybdotransferase